MYAMYGAYKVFIYKKQNKSKEKNEDSKKFYYKQKSKET